MSEPYVGEILMFGGNFAPIGWAFCDGNELPISQNDVLFNLIGTTYGGDGEQTFKLPDLQGRVPIHMGKNSSGSNYTLAETGGVESVTLSISQMAAHSHAPMAVAGGTNQQESPSGALWSNDPSNAISTYHEMSGGASLNPMTSLAIQTTGGSQPHDNIQPYLAVNFCIALFGLYPQPT